ncbi:MAG TPA: hypothetical protein VI754_06770 [Bacteriovoracaceae bacterium]|nr:hypothetical protein [Bacteriovoracaceae bacterium]
MQNRTLTTGLLQKIKAKASCNQDKSGKKNFNYDYHCYFVGIFFTTEVFM